LKVSETGKIFAVRNIQNKIPPRRRKAILGGIYQLKGDNDMRLDKYLKVSRIIKRRTVANEACDSGRVMLNDKVARASAEVKVGDVIEIAFGNKSVKVRITSVQETIRKEDAKEMFEYL
jgi:ribosomal 50S subunit-recycling heat shock protein